MGGKRGKYVPRPCGYRENEAFEELGEGQCGCSRKNKEEGHRLALNFSSEQQETLRDMSCFEVRVCMLGGRLTVD